MSYATVAALRQYLKQAPTDQTATDTMQAILDRATALIDLELGYSFTATVADTRTAWSDGTAYLPIEPATAVTLITAPDGYSVPEYVIDGGYAVALRNGARAPLLPALRPYAGAGAWQPWGDGLAWQVTATYGTGDPPADIVEACLEIAAHLWKAKDSGFATVIGVEGAGAVEVAQAYTPIVRRILAARRRGSSTIGVW